MTPDPSNSQTPYAAPRADYSDQAAVDTSTPTRRQSWLGIASFVMAMLGGLLAFALLVIAGVMEVNTPGGIDEESTQAILVGLGVFGVIGFHLLGIGLGIGGLIQANRVRIFCVIGLSLNLLVILGLVGLMVLGLAMQA